MLYGVGSDPCPAPKSISSGRIADVGRFGASDGAPIVGRSRCFGRISGVVLFGWPKGRRYWANFMFPTESLMWRRPLPPPQNTRRPGRVSESDVYLQNIGFRDARVFTRLHMGDVLISSGVFPGRLCRGDDRSLLRHARCRAQRRRRWGVCGGPIFFVSQCPIFRPFPLLRLFPLCALLCVKPLLLPIYLPRLFV